MNFINEVKKNIKNENILFFDLDGTLIDTDEANFLSYQKALKEVKNIDLTLLYKGNNRFTQENLYHLIPLLTTQEYNQIVNIKKTLYKNYINKTKLNHFALEIINLFCKTHKIVLVTKSSKNRANQLLMYYNLIDRFDYKFFKEDYKNKSDNKFEYVLKILKVSPKQVIIFENDKDEIKQALLSNIPYHNIINLNIQGRKKL